MSEHSDHMADLVQRQWEREVRGYNRQQVDEYVAQQNMEIRQLQQALGDTHGEMQRIAHELGEARQNTARPPHQEISERVGQILKLAADEAKADRERTASELAQQREVVTGETDKLRADTKRETDKIRADAQDQAERMLTAAQEQSEHAVSTARAEAEKLRSAAQADAERTVSEANSHAENAVAAAVAQAKQQLDEATARATAIREGAERRLNLLISRHTETIRRLTEIRDVSTSLVAGEIARGSLEDEVARALGAGQAGNSGDSRPGGGHQADPLQGGHRAGSRAAGPDGRAGGPDGRPLGGPDGRHQDARRPAGPDGRQPAAAAEGRQPAVPVPADPLDALPAQPAGGTHREGGRYPAVQGRAAAAADSARHTAEGSRLPADSLRRSGDGARLPAEGARHSGATASEPAAEEAHDDTMTNGLAITD